MKRHCLLIAFFAFLMSVSQAQNCKDTLFVQIKNVGIVVNLEDDYNPLKGDTLNQQKTPKLYLVTDILFLKNYKSFDSLDLEYLLTHGEDTLLHSTDRKRIYGDYQNGENEEYVHIALQMNDWHNGEYRLSVKVLGSSVDGVFCDSIQDLSAYQCVFYLDKSSGVANINCAVVQLFPNPARERISVSCETEMRSVTLCNALGQQLLRVNPNAPQAELQVAGLPRGLYLLRVETAGGTAVRKVVVE